MAKKSFLNKIFKEEKKDKRQEMQRRFNKFLCDHKITEKHNEYTLLDPIKGDGGEDPKFKCSKCKNKNIPGRIYTPGEIYELSKELNGIIEIIKTSIDFMDEKLLYEFAEKQLFIEMVADMYQSHFLNKRGERRADDDDEGFGDNDGEVLYYNSGDSPFGDIRKKDKDKNKSYYKKNKNNHKDKGGKNKNKNKHNKGNKKGKSVHDLFWDR